jgi:hypothetical protein
MARAMQPNATDAQLIAHLMEHSPDDGELSVDPLATVEIDVGAGLAAAFDRVAARVEHNLRRVAGDKFTVDQKRIVLKGCIQLMNRLYGLADGMEKHGEASASEYVSRARELETDVTGAADALDCAVQGDSVGP